MLQKCLTKFFCFRDLDVQKSEVIINLETFLTAFNKLKLTLYCRQAGTVTQEVMSHQKIYTHSNTLWHKVASATRRKIMIQVKWLTDGFQMTDKAGLFTIKLEPVTLLSKDYRLLPVTEMLWHLKCVSRDMSLRRQMSSSRMLRDRLIGSHLADCCAWSLCTEPEDREVTSAVMTNIPLLKMTKEQSSRIANTSCKW